MNEETITINRQQYKELYQIACGSWKQRMLVDYNMSLVDEIQVPKTVIDQAITEASKEVAIKIQEILKLFPKEGTLVLVFYEPEWYLRFADGKGGFYCDQKQSGKTLHNYQTVPFDLNNLPKELIWSKS